MVERPSSVPESVVAQSEVEQTPPKNVELSNGVKLAVDSKQFLISLGDVFLRFEQERWQYSFNGKGAQSTEPQHNQSKPLEKIFQVATRIRKILRAKRWGVQDIQKNPAMLEEIKVLVESDEPLKTPESDPPPKPSRIA